MKQVINKKEGIALGIAAVVLLLAATFGDLALSQAVYNQQNLYGLFFEAFGELPGVLVAVFSSAALMVTMPKPLNFKRWLGLIGLGLLMVSYGLMGGSMPVSYLGGPTAVSILLGVVFVAGSLWLASRVDQQHHAALRRAAVIGLLAFVGAVFFITLIKMGWGRPRFRSMIDPITQFTPWFLPQGLAAGNEFMSFPSGHTANSAVILWIALIPSFVPALAGKEQPLKIAAFLWIGMVMFSRIIMGAHFLSDVTMGAIISIGFFCLLCRWIKEKIPVENK